MSHETIETVDLEVFLSVARNESITGAARELRMAAPSVSARIAALERKLGVDLFDRTTRGSFPTAAGDEFRGYARRCLDLLEDAHLTVHTSGDRPITVAVPASLGNVIMGPVLRTLNAAGIAANGRVADTSLVIDHVLDGSVDIGFTVNGVVPRGLTSQRVCRSPVRAVVRPGHPLLSTRSSFTIDDIARFPMAIYRWHDEAESIGHVLADSRRNLQAPTVYVGLPTAIVDLALHADYVGLVGEFGVARDLDRQVICDLPLSLPTWSIDIDLVHRRNSVQWRAIEVLTAALDDFARALSPTVAPRLG